MINILIVDDSETETKILTALLENQKDFKVIGHAKNGQEAIKLAGTLKPDLITMDIQMPFIDGIEATNLIMSQHPTPIVIISSKVNDEELNASFLALEAGAVSVLEKPKNVSSATFKTDYQYIIDTIRSMAEIKVIKRRFNIHTSKKIVTPDFRIKKGIFEIVGLGSSVGGPQALHTILGKLPADFPVPIVIVQHMTKGFINGFSKWLNNNVSLKIKDAENHEFLQSGTVYIAPDNHHLEICRVNGKLATKLVSGPPISGFCPSATVLLKSIAKVCGKNAIGGLLTGMGSDGAQGLLELKQAEGHTFIQDKESAVVFGMAGVAQSLGAVDKIVQLDQIANYLTKITAKNP